MATARRPSRSRRMPRADSGTADCRVRPSSVPPRYDSPDLRISFGEHGMETEGINTNEHDVSFTNCSATSVVRESATIVHPLHTQNPPLRGNVAALHSIRNASASLRHEDSSASLAGPETRCEVALLSLRAEAASSQRNRIPFVHTTFQFCQIQILSCKFTAHSHELYYCIVSEHVFLPTVWLKPAGHQEEC